MVYQSVLTLKQECVIENSTDIKILTWIAEELQKQNIGVKLRCIAKKGQFFTTQYKFNSDLWRININEAISLLRLIRYIKPFIKHQTRLLHMIICERNINQRIKKGTVRYAI